MTAPLDSGCKYRRAILGLKKHHPDIKKAVVYVDVYSVLTAFNVTIPGLQHATKKILCAGLRGKATILVDLLEARDALDRAIEDVQNQEE